MAVDRMRLMEERKDCACTGGRNELWRGALILVLFTQICTCTSSTAKKPKQKEYAVTVGINMRLCKKISTSTWPDPQKDTHTGKEGGRRLGETGILHSDHLTNNTTAAWIHTGAYYVNTTLPYDRELGRKHYPHAHTVSLSNQRHYTTGSPCCSISGLKFM